MGFANEWGAYGEAEAVAFLRKEGFIIMETNWRSGKYELDIIAEKGDRIHFIEVKLRKAGSLTSPEEAITKKKGDNLLKAANHYLGLHKLMRESQIDLVAIDAYEGGELDIRYIPNAVLPRW